MNCKEVQDQLVDYLEGRFGNEARRLAEHIESCDECRQEYRDLRETIRLVRGIELKDPGADFWREQRASIKETARTAGKPDRAGKGLLRQWPVWLPELRRLVFPTGYRLAGTLAITLLFISWIMYAGKSTLIHPPGEHSFMLDEEVLGEVYLSGAISGGYTTIEELDELTDRELGVAWRWMIEDYEPWSGSLNEGLHSLGGGFDLEAEVGRLDTTEMKTLLELLEQVPAAG